jgi:CcmD family protein
VIALALSVLASAQDELDARIAEEKYVAAAYLVVFAFLLVYVLLIATKLSRLERDVEELTRLARERKDASDG